MPRTEAGKQFLGLTQSLARDNAVDRAESWIDAIEAEARGRLDATERVEKFDAVANAVAAERARIAKAVRRMGGWGHEKLVERAAVLAAIDKESE